MTRKTGAFTNAILSTGLAALLAFGSTDAATADERPTTPISGTPVTHAEGELPSLQISDDSTTTKTSDKAGDDPVSLDLSLHNETGIDATPKPGANTSVSPLRTKVQASLTGLGDEDRALYTTFTNDQQIRPATPDKDLFSTSVSTASSYLALQPDEKQPEGLTGVGANVFHFGDPTDPSITYIEGFFSAANATRDSHFGRNKITGIVGVTPQTGADGGPQQNYIFAIADSDHSISGHDVDLGSSFARFGKHLFKDAATHGNLEVAVNDIYAGAFTADGDHGGVISFRSDVGEDGAADLAGAGFYQNGESGSHYAKAKLALGQDEGAYGSSAEAATDEFTFSAVPSLHIDHTMMNGENTAVAQYVESGGDIAAHVMGGHEAEMGDVEVGLGLGVDINHADGHTEVYAKPGVTLQYQGDGWGISAEVIGNDGKPDAYISVSKDLN